MERSTRRTLVIGGLSLAILLVLAYVFSLQVRKPASRLPYYSFNVAENKIEKTSTLGQHIGTFSFTDQLNNPFTQEEVKNTVFVADYFFVQCPGICKRMSSELQRVYAKFEQQTDFKILSHTSKPEEDSVEALMDYAKMYGVKDQSKWVFLTGNKKELYQVARSQYFIVDEEGDGGEDDFIHTERFVLVDKQGYLRGYYDGTDSIDVDRLMIDIQDLLQQ